MNPFESSLNRFDGFGVPAERVRWTGTPAGGIRLQRSDIVLIPFSLMWGGFAIFWEAIALGSDGTTPIIFKLWGIPFVLVGLYMIAGRFLWDAYVRANTSYALTDDSALILQRGVGGGLSSVYLPNVSNLTLQSRPDGSGTIYFGDAPTFTDQIGRSRTPQALAFWSIPNVSAVYDKCEAARRHVPESS